MRSHALLAASMLVAWQDFALVSPRIALARNGEVATIMDDARVERSVRPSLLEFLAEDAVHVDVRARGGAVRLSGWVTDETMRDRAEKAAYAVDVVEHVDNRIRIVAPPANPRGM